MGDYMFFKRKIQLHHIGTVNIETRRFILRKFDMDDADDVYNNWTSHQESAKYNAWKVHDSVNETKEYLDMWIKSYEKTDNYHWAIVDKKTKEVIGSISASNIKNKNKYCEIGYTVATKCWNQGIATEVLIEVLRFLTEEIGFVRIHALHDVRNKASGRVMEKAGMKYLKDTRHFILNSSKLIMNCSVYEYNA